jgi:hypothetical protein
MIFQVCDLMLARSRTCERESLDKACFIPINSPKTNISNLWAGHGALQVLFVGQHKESSSG